MSQTSRPVEIRSILDDLGEEVTGIMTPITICMALTVFLVRVLNPSGSSSSNSVFIASIAYAEQASDSSSKKFGGALLNALIFVAVVATMTAVLFALFYYQCYKIIYGYMAFAVFNIFFLLTGLLMIQLFQVWNWHVDAFSFTFLLYNFSVVGTLGVLFIPIPLLAKQSYLVWTGVIVAYIFTFIPEWTSWVLLCLMAVYDIAAVLMPGGPLKALVDIAINRQVELPALIYEARPVGRGYQRGYWARRGDTALDGEESAAPAAAAGSSGSVIASVPSPAATADRPPAAAAPADRAGAAAVNGGSAERRPDVVRCQAPALHGHGHGAPGSSAHRSAVAAAADADNRQAGVPATDDGRRTPVKVVALATMGSAGGSGSATVSHGHDGPDASSAAILHGRGAIHDSGPSGRPLDALPQGGAGEHRIFSAIKFSTTPDAPVAAAATAASAVAASTTTLLSPAIKFCSTADAAVAEERPGSGDAAAEPARREVGASRALDGGGQQDSHSVPIEKQTASASHTPPIADRAPVSSSGLIDHASTRRPASRSKMPTESGRPVGEGREASGGSIGPDAAGAGRSADVGSGRASVAGEGRTDGGRLEAPGSLRPQLPSILSSQRRAQADRGSAGGAVGPPQAPGGSSGTAADGRSAPARAPQDHGGLATQPSLQLLLADDGGGQVLIERDSTEPLITVAAGVSSAQDGVLHRSTGQRSHDGESGDVSLRRASNASNLLTAPSQVELLSSHRRIATSSHSPATAAVMDVEQQQPPSTRPQGDEVDIPDSIKLGLGDFIFYSMLVGRAAMYDYMTVFASYLAIVAGLGLTLLCLAVFQRALPALPFSIALGVLFYFLTRIVLEPFIVPLVVHEVYF